VQIIIISPQKPSLANSNSGTAVLVATTSEKPAIFCLLGTADGAMKRYSKIMMVSVKFMMVLTFLDGYLDLIPLTLATLRWSWRRSYDRKTETDIFKFR
jgi:hypothetical protein